MQASHTISCSSSGSSTVQPRCCQRQTKRLIHKNKTDKVVTKCRLGSKFVVRHLFFLWNLTLQWNQSSQTTHWIISSLTYMVIQKIIAKISQKINIAFHWMIWITLNPGHQIKIKYLIVSVWVGSVTRAITTPEVVIVKISVVFLIFGL